MSEEVKNLLSEVQLESFFVKIRDDLQVTKLKHFENVKPHDLAKIGMPKPAIRRLLKTWRELSSVAKPGLVKFGSDSVHRKDGWTREVPALACLIGEADLELMEKLGDGSFGVVRKALWRKTGQLVAVKVLKRDLLSEQVLEDFISEVNVMHRLQHRHLIKLHGVCLGPHHMMVTELAPMGALLDYVHRHHDAILLSKLHLYASQLAEALAYLEANNLIHRDIALRNVLLLNEEHIKLADFGLARVLKTRDDVYVMAPERKVPYAWCAPESLKRREFTAAADAWMYAVTLWELFSFGQEPWLGLNGAQILHAIDGERRRLARPECCPPPIYQLMLQCWLPDPLDRPTFHAMRAFLAETHPVEMKARVAVAQAGERRLRLEPNDHILIVDGRSDKRWWFGQNKRTLVFGHVPRPALDPLRPLSKADISRPLVSTFVHLGSAEAPLEPQALPTETPPLLPDDGTTLNPTYLPCRKSQRPASGPPRVVTEPVPQKVVPSTEVVQPKVVPTQNGLLDHANPFEVSNPFEIDVFQPELFDPVPKPMSKPAAVSKPVPVSRPIENLRPASLIDRSSAHYAHLPQPLLPPPPDDGRQPESRARSSAPADGQVSFTDDSFPAMHAHLAGVFGATLRPAHSTDALVPSELFVRLPPPASFRRPPVQVPSTTPTLTQPPASQAPQAAPLPMAAPRETVAKEMPLPQPVAPSQPFSCQVLVAPAPTVPATTSCQVQVHRAPVGPLLEGNYRTAKFCELASLSPSRQSRPTTNGHANGQKEIGTSRYTRSAEVLSQLRDTLELSQQLRSKAEQDAKVQQLLALGLASDQRCRQVLAKHGWNLEAAGSELADEAR